MNCALALEKVTKAEYDALGLLVTLFEGSCENLAGVTPSPTAGLVPYAT